MFEKLCSYTSRLFFAVASLLFVIGIWEIIIAVFGWRLTWIPYKPGRLIEYAVVFLIFVITILLRQIRDALKK